MTINGVSVASAQRTNTGCAPPEARRTYVAPIIHRRRPPSAGPRRAHPAKRTWRPVPFGALNYPQRRRCRYLVPSAQQPTATQRSATQRPSCRSPPASAPFIFARARPFLSSSSPSAAALSSSPLLHSGFVSLPASARLSPRSAADPSHHSIRPRVSLLAWAAQHDSPDVFVVVSYFPVLETTLLSPICRPYYNLLVLRGTSLYPHWHHSITSPSNQHYITSALSTPPPEPSRTRN